MPKMVGGARIELRRDGIIHAVAETRRKHTIDDAKAITSAVREVFALAVVTTSTLGRVIGNFMVGMSSGQLPIRLFSDEESALAWLKTLPKK